MHKKSLEDIFADDDMGLLDEVPKESYILTDEDRLIEAFEEINGFYEKNNRAPNKSSMSEYSLAARLEEYKSNERKKAILKNFDRFNLLGELETKKDPESVDDILDDDDLGLLEPEGEESIFEFKHAPKPGSRAEADYIARRESLSEKDFKKYDELFKKVHKELKLGKRQLKPFHNAEDNLKEGHFYLVDGLLAYLEVSKAEETLKENKSGDRIRLEGRTVTVFENGTVSNMLFRSLGKAVHKNGKLVTASDEQAYEELKENTGQVNEDDVKSGWIYVLKSKSINPEITNIENLYKIGLSSKPVQERIKNARHEATYLFDDLEEIASYKCYSLNLQALENLLHHFFEDVRLDVELKNKGKKFTPREWFVVPLPIIDEAIDLVLNGTITDYRYDKGRQKIVIK